MRTHSDPPAGSEYVGNTMGGADKQAGIRRSGPLLTAALCASIRVQVESAMSNKP